jgi:hypothetical protein
MVGVTQLQVKHCELTCEAALIRPSLALLDRPGKLFGAYSLL